MKLVPFYILLLLVQNKLKSEAFNLNTCERIPPLRYCPPFNSSQWKNRALCKDCTDQDTKYHCSKDYDSPKSNCHQNDYDCENEAFVDGCAKEKICQKGEEPVLSFIKNQQRQTKPEVYCVRCYNSNRYNNAVAKSSATFSECPKKKLNICTPDTHKIECKVSDSTSERFCRCDARNGYYPYSHPDDHPTGGCSYTDYECTNRKPKCEPNLELLLNYTCAAICKTGYYRADNSDECAPSPTTESTLNTKTSAVTTSVTETSKISTTITSQPDTNTTKSTATSGNTKLIYQILIPCGVAVVIVIIFIVLWKKGCFRKCNENGETGIHTSETGMFVFPDAATSTNEQQSNVRPTRHPPSSASSSSVTNIVYNVTNMVQATKAKCLTINMPHPTDTRSETEESDEEETSFMLRQRDSSPENRTHVLRKNSNTERKTFWFSGQSEHNMQEPNQTQSLDRRQKPSLNKGIGGSESDVKIPTNVKKLFNLSKAEYREFVSTVLRKSHTKMIDCLNPVPVLDIFTRRQILTETVIRDIKEEPNTSSSVRHLLKRIKEKGTVCFMPFKEALSESGQQSCLEEIEKHESSAYRDLLTQRKKTENVESDNSEEEICDEKYETGSLKF